jgi:inosine triphosphate pyrophosphatase
MTQLTIVTGNTNKREELRRLLPSHIQFNFVNIDLDEIQHNDPVVVVADKARRAYDALSTPVLVEDVSAGLVSWNGLPGPFIKFFELSLGADALYKLAGDDKRAEVICMLGYYDGETLLTFQGTTKGSVVPARGHHKFGFDCVFVPDNHQKTYAEMSVSEKDAVSHRAEAVAQLKQHPLFEI